MTVVMEPNVFLTLFEQWNLPEGWLAGLIDHNGNFIARSRNHEQNVGRPASEGFRSAARAAAMGWNETHLDRRRTGWRRPMSPRP